MGGNPLLGAWERLVPGMRRLAHRLGHDWTELQTSFDPDRRRRWAAILRDPGLDADVRAAARRLKLERRALRRRFAYSVPSGEALDLIASWGRPLVEIGAGKGYWARLLRARGAEVVASDAHAVSGNRWVTGETAFVDDLVVGAAVRELAAAYPRHALMLQWPVPDAAARFPLEALAAFAGRELVFVGEDAPGVCGSRAFHDRLARTARLERRLPLPRFPGILDGVSLYAL